MNILKSFCIAFSMYSRIPMPQFEWKKENMRYALVFFPWVGAAIGGAVAFFSWLCGILGIGDICRVFIGAAIPLLITGGIHLDGFMDTMDAFCSCRQRGRKLEIMADPHVGAFSVLMLAAYGLVFLGAFSQIPGGRFLRVACAGFFLSRCLSGIAAVTFPLAKNDGLLHDFSDTGARGRARLLLILQALACAAYMLWSDLPCGLAATLAALASLAYYYRRAVREIGGITGDTEGYFVCICEAAMFVAVAACAVAGGRPMFGG